MQNKFSKKLGIIIIALLTISTLSAAMPFASATITNRPTVYVDDTTADPLMVQAGTYVNISTSGMTITGAQIWLWLSTYGGSEIDRSAGDRWYAGPFYLGDVTNSTPKAVPMSAGSVPAPFDAEGRSYSFVVGNGWINGTVPLLVQGSNIDYWIKIADQSPRDIIVGSEVGVSTNRVRFTTGFGATPLAGAPDTLVTVSGYAIQTGIVYNITQGAQLVAYFVPSTTHNVSGWLWTGFDVPFNIMDLQGLCTTSPSVTAPVNITVTNHNTTLLAASWNFIQTYREVYLTTGTFRAHNGIYAGVLTLNTGALYNFTTAWFPANGAVSVYLNTTLVASSIGLNGTGGNVYTTLTIPALVTGTYFFRVIDNNNVEYNFTVAVQMVPYITLNPAMGYVGDQFTVTGTNFLDYVGQYITIYFENTMGGGYVMLWNETIASSGWVSSVLTVPQSWGGARLVEARTANGTVVIDDATFTVLAKIDVVPDCINNTVCQVVPVVGTGFMYSDGEENIDFFVYIDNELYFGDDEDWEQAINATGYIMFEFAAAGFRPGLHVVSVIMDTEGNTPWTIYAKDNFCVTTLGDPIVDYLVSLNMTMAELEATIISVNGTVATLDTTVGQLQVDLTAIGATVTSIDGDVATIQTTLGSIQTSLTSMNAKLTSIQNDIASINIPGLGTIETKLDTIDAVIGSMYGDVVEISTAIGTFETTLDSIDATVSAVGNTVDAMDTVVGVIAGDVVEIQTTLGTIEGTITDIDDNVATIVTDLGTVKVDLASAKTDIAAVEDDVNTALPVDMLPVWIAVVLALIAAIGSIAGVFIIQRKIA